MCEMLLVTVDLEQAQSGACACINLTTPCHLCSEPFLHGLLELNSRCTCLPAKAETVCSVCLNMATDLCVCVYGCVYTHSLLAEAVHRALVPTHHPHETVQRAALVVEAAVRVNLAPAVEHDLGAQRVILHQHPPVVQHLPLTVPAHRPA